ncbi:hypothetical protein V6N13_044467 [Hibiscus sabdariffa]|uniref:Uncharacterized protein n=1 Tax=Hibiscus sabdariffa TaxID=183260 RepID=A0ABR2RIL4_9ROSI
MASSPFNVQPSFHARSNSLPSRQHPITSQIDENLHRTEGVSIGLYIVIDRTSTQLRGIKGLANEIRKYLTSRKAVRKAICKALKNLKHMENKFSSSSFSKNGETGTVISTLKQVETVTISVLESLLSFISGPEAESKLSRWSLVSKLVQQKRVTCEEEHHKSNEIVNAEATLRSLMKSGNMKHIGNVQNDLQNSELCIQDLDENLESLFRRLIKARVTVLNILNC